VLRKFFYLLIIGLTLQTTFACAESAVSESDLLEQQSPASTEVDKKTEAAAKNDKRDDRSIFVNLLLYLPNRIFDVMDIVKAKVRAGPGVSVGAQVTEPVSIFLGAHTDIYVGLPGPRLERIVPIPVGAEAVAGASLSVLDWTVNSDTTRDKGSKRKSQTEISAEVQLILVGLEIGIDPVEILDAFTGLIFIDIRDDDL